MANVKYWVFDPDELHERLELLNDAWMLFNHWPDYHL